MRQVNRELKKLLVASVGDDLQYHFERLAREKNQLILENEALGRSLAHTAEQLERMSIQCDVWRSKFLASRYDTNKVNGCFFAVHHNLLSSNLSSFKRSFMWKRICQGHFNRHKSTEDDLTIVKATCQVNSCIYVGFFQSHGRRADKCQSSSAETDQRGTRSNSGPAVRERGVFPRHGVHTQVIKPQIHNYYIK